MIHSDCPEKSYHRFLYLSLRPHRGRGASTLPLRHPAIRFYNSVLRHERCATQSSGGRPSERGGTETIAGSLGSDYALHLEFITSSIPTFWLLFASRLKSRPAVVKQPYVFEYSFAISEYILLICVLLICVISSSVVTYNVLFREFTQQPNAAASHYTFVWKIICQHLVNFSQDVVGFKIDSILEYAMCFWNILIRTHRILILWILVAKKCTKWTKYSLIITYLHLIVT